MANGRVGQVEDVLNLGDAVKVEVIEVGDNGKISLDRIDKPDAPQGSSRPRRDTDSRSDRGQHECRQSGRRPGDQGAQGDHRRPRSRKRD